MTDSVDQAAELARLRGALAEAQETLRAIRAGEVDALVVSEAAPGEQIFTLSTADRPYRMFVDTMADGAATVSERGIVLYANRRLTELLGVPQHKLVGAPISSFIPARYRHLVTAGDGEPDEHGSTEVEVLIEGRVPLWVRVGSSTLDVDGERMLCLTFADLTQARVDQAALTTAHQAALLALRARSQFVANMSHEIRTPLNGVIGMANLMLTTELTEEQTEYADGIRASGDALMSVVDQILDFSKLDAGHLEVEDLPFSPLSVVEDTCFMMAAGAHAKGVEVIAEVVGKLPQLVSGDYLRLRQVLSNLLSNAVKFTAAGHVCAAVSASEESGRWRLRFTVTDTGIGVPPAAAGRIFESFSQADGSTTRQFGGTGLGLAICRQLVALMGGEIGVESGRGTGSTFWFTVLVGAVPDEEPPEELRVPLRGRVLLVDDNAVSRRVLEDLLVRWGLTCVPVASGEDALELCRAERTIRRPFDLLITDCDMPGMTGISLTRSLRSHPRQDADPPPRTPIVVMVSAHRDRAVAMQAGADLVVSKPVRRTLLHAELVAALKLAQSHPVEPEPVDLPPASKPVQVLVPLPEAPEGADRDRQLTRLVDQGNRSVLLVEDNKVNQLVAVRMLQKRGFEVDVAVNGQVAVDMYAHQPYLAIFMDCHMPVLDGYQATAEIRRREPAGRRIPILAMTANTMKGDREKCLAAGMDDYLGKPFSGESLNLAIARTLQLEVESH